MRSYSYFCVIMGGSVVLYGALNIARLSTVAAPGGIGIKGASYA